MANGVVQCPDEAATVALGRRFGARAVGGGFLALCGDLGAGKTHFVKGVVAGLGSNDAVSSPTFSLVHEYTGGRLPVFHFDFYRLDEAAEVVAIGWDEYVEEARGLVVVEWADKFPDLVPAEAAWLRFRVTEAGGREVEIVGEANP